MGTPELHISTDFATDDHISQEKLLAYFSVLRKTKAFIFALCIRGRVKVVINLVQYNIGSGTMIAIPADSFIHVLKASEDIQMHAIFFSLPFIHETRLDKPTINTFYIISERPLLPTRVRRDAPFLFSRATLKSILEALLQGFTELGQRKALLQVAPPDKQSAIFRQFVRLVQDHYTQQHQVQFYAAEMGLKPTQLCHIVKKKSEGQTAMRIINNVLILDARTLLRTTSTPVKDIALNLGFNNASFFNQFFKKHVGMTPQQFRNSEK